MTTSANASRSPEARIPAAILGCLAASGAALLIINTHLGAYFALFPIAYLVTFKLSPHRFSFTFSLVSVALIVRLLASYLVPTVVVFDDELEYVTQGEDVLRQINLGARDPWHPNPYVNVSAGLFWLFSASAHTLKAFNSALGVISAYMLFRIASRIFDNPKASFATLFACLFLPPIVFISAIALKEQVISFALIGTLYGIVEGSWRGMSVSACFLALITVFRASLAVFIVPALGAYLGILLVRRFRASRSLKVSLVVVGLAVFTVLMVVIVQQSVVQETKAMLFLSGVGGRAKDALGERGSEFSGYLDVDNPLAPRNLLLAPIRAVYFPSPLRPLKTPEIHVWFESLALSCFVYLAMPYFALGAFASGRRALIVLTTALYGVVFLSSAYSVLTAAPEFFRYRWPGFPIFFMLAVAGWYSGSRVWRWRAQWAWWLSASAFSFLYLL